MPRKSTVQKARQDARDGKSASTQAGEFVREEIHHIRDGEHGARSAKQAIAIGLAKARRAGVKLKPPAQGQASTATRKRAERDYEVGQTRPHKTPSPKRSKAALDKLKGEGHAAASHLALARHAKMVARKK